MLYPLFFKPNLFPKVWGGQRLRELKGVPPGNDPIGESWEVSAVPGCSSVVANGYLKGKCLREVVSNYGAELLGKSVFAKFGTEFPLLVKFIDAYEDLSIQVHPDDSLAKQRHGCMGKNEMWYVVDAIPGSCIYSGFKKNISREEYCRRVEDDSICDVLAKHPINIGDAFFIPAGRVHAICGGSLILEIQQSCDITYRIYDYGRKGSDGRLRELHTELALDALDFSIQGNSSLNYSDEINATNVVCECEYFSVNSLRLDARMHRDLKNLDSFVIYVCLGGECKIGGKFSLSYGECCLVPASCADVTITPVGETGVVELMEVYVSNV